MNGFFRNNKRNNIIFTALASVVFVQFLVIGKLFTQKDNKNYEVNLVKINTVKDSVNYAALKNNLLNVDLVVRQLNSYLVSKNASNLKIENLAKDSLSSKVYLSKQANRYSQYLVNLERKLQNVPLGIPANGYISSDFGKRKNPIPFSTVLASVTPVKKMVDSSAVVANVSTKTKGAAISVDGERDQMQFHKGIDIAATYGSDVIAAASGKVLFAGQKGGYGNCVIISHQNGLATLYGHLSSISVVNNQDVKVGEVIAKTGNSGRSTGPHLHYEVHKNKTPVNPKLFMSL